MKTKTTKKPTKKRLILKNRIEKQELIEFSDFILIFSVKLGNEFSIRFGNINTSKFSEKSPVNFIERNDFNSIVLYNTFDNEKNQANILFKAYILKFAIDKFLNHDELIKKYTHFKLNFTGYGSGEVGILNLLNHKIIMIKDCNSQLDLKVDKNSDSTDNILITDFLKIVRQYFKLFYTRVC